MWVEGHRNRPGTPGAVSVSTTVDSTARCPLVHAVRAQGAPRWGRSPLGIWGEVGPSLHGGTLYEPNGATRASRALARENHAPPPASLPGARRAKMLRPAPGALREREEIRLPVPDGSRLRLAQDPLARRRRLELRPRAGSRVCRPASLATSRSVSVCASSIPNPPDPGAPQCREVPARPVCSQVPGQTPVRRCRTKPPPERRDPGPWLRSPCTTRCSRDARTGRTVTG